MLRKWMLFGCVSAFLAVALGAMAAHTLREKYELSADRLMIFETGARYQMYHSLAIIAAALFAAHSAQGRLLNIAAGLFAAGIILFSGSLYLLGPRQLLGIEEWRWLGPLTPIGGLCFLAGWAVLAWAALKHKRN